MFLIFPKARARLLYRRDRPSFHSQLVARLAGASACAVGSLQEVQRAVEPAVPMSFSIVLVPFHQPNRIGVRAAGAQNLATPSGVMPPHDEWRPPETDAFFFAKAAARARGNRLDDYGERPLPKRKATTRLADIVQQRRGHQCAWRGPFLRQYPPQRIQAVQLFRARHGAEGFVFAAREMPARQVQVWRSREGAQGAQALRKTLNRRLHLARREAGGAGRSSAGR